jgi:FG-GAP-like repeat
MGPGNDQVAKQGRSNLTRMNSNFDKSVGLDCLKLAWLLPAIVGVQIWTELETYSYQRPAPTVTFEDVTMASGLRFQHRNSTTSKKYFIETMTGGVATFDYNKDGWLDVFFLNGASLKDPQPDGETLDKSLPEYWNRLFKNNRDGTFTDVTQKAGLQGKGYGMGVAAADYNNDGFTDLFVTNYGYSMLYRNRGDGSFTDMTAQAKSRRKAAPPVLDFWITTMTVILTYSSVAMWTGTSLSAASSAVLRDRTGAAIVIPTSLDRHRVICSKTTAMERSRT